MTTSPKAYLVIELDIFDPATFQDYRAQVAPMIASYGGRYLVRGGETEALEGEPPLGRVILLEFPDVAAARSFMTSDEYRPIAEIRYKSANSRIYLVEGYAP